MLVSTFSNSSVVISVLRPMTLPWASLTADAGRSITSPAAIASATARGSSTMRGGSSGFALSASPIESVPDDRPPLTDPRPSSCDSAHQM